MEKPNKSTYKLTYHGDNPPDPKVLGEFLEKIIKDGIFSVKKTSSTKKTS